MHLRRQSFTNEATPSIEPGAHSGRGTAQREDNSGLQPDRRNVIAVTKGRKIDNAPVSEEKTDLVQMGRAQIMARSGNDAGQHEEEHEDDSEGFDELAAGDPGAPALDATTGRNVLVLGLAALALLWAWKR